MQNSSSGDISENCCKAYLLSYAFLSVFLYFSLCCKKSDFILFSFLVGDSLSQHKYVVFTNHEVVASRGSLLSPSAPLYTSVPVFLIELLLVWLHLCFLHSSNSFFLSFRGESFAFTCSASIFCYILKAPMYILISSVYIVKVFSLSLTNILHYKVF